MREATVSRKTKETDIEVTVSIDGTGLCSASTGIGFFDHMLEQLARHSSMDIKVRAKGDLHIDAHHTVEDVGIALGQAIKKALGERLGVERFSDVHLVMDEALTRVACDISGRPYLVFETVFPTEKIGEFDTQLVKEFFQALSSNSAIALHIDNLRGSNSHHIAESCFKGVARALGIAFRIDPRRGKSVPSTKGSLLG